MLDFVGASPRRGGIAVRWAEGALTHAELVAMVESRCARLAAMGIRARDRVVLGCSPSLETIANAVALIERRCTVLPIAGDAPDDRVQSVCASFAPAWWVRDDGVSRPAVAGGIAPEAGEEPPLQALLSSGSSGQPKIVLRSASQVAAGVRIFAAGVSLGPGDRVLALVPFAHSFGFNSVLLGALSSGAEIVLPRSRHPRGIVEEIEETGTTLFPAPPVFFDWMDRFAAQSHHPLGSVRACLSVGDVLPHATHAAFVDRFEVPLWQSYGASEAGPALLNRTGVHAGGAMALGHPYPGVTVDLCDPSGSRVPPGEVGEIVIGSPAVGLGYLAEHDGDSRIEGRRFYTGDRGVRRGDEIHFSGRTKTLITRAGRKIDPAEVERVLRTHPDVLDAAVRVAGETGTDPLEALVVARSSIAPEDLIEICRRSLEPHAVPRIIAFRAALPRDATGKLQRARLRTW